MAEIRLQRRRRSSTWPWLLILVLPFAYLLYWGSRGHETLAGDLAADSATAYMIPRDTMPPPDAIGIFATFVSGADSARDEPAERAYVATAIHRLADAAAMLNAADAPSNQRSLAAARKQADAIQAMERVAPAYQGGERLHAAAVSIADVLELSQRAAYPRARDAVVAVRVAAGDIRTTQPLAPQHAAVQRFFAAARDALVTMRPPA